MDSAPPADPRRRRLLKRLGLAATLGYAAPVLLPLSAARASDSISVASPPSHPSPPSAPSVPSVSRPPRPERELVVALDDRQALSVLAEAGYPVLASDEVGLVGAVVARLGLRPGGDLAAALAEIAALVPGALAAENDLYRPSELPCGPEGCAAFEMVGWPAAPGCGTAVRIGMIDTAVNADHPALAGQRLEIVALEQAGRPAAAPVHGTAIAALLVGGARSTTPGLLPEAELVAVEAFHGDALGDAADAFSLVRALDALAGRGVGTVNLSFSGPDNPLLERAVAALVARDVALAAAAGNDGPAAPPLFPAAYPGVVAVTAVDGGAQVYRQAAAGAHIAFAAPGVQLWTAASVSGGRFRSGTSYATPFVTAALAAIRAGDPGRSAEAAVEVLAAGAEDLGPPGRDETFGFGLVRGEGLCGE